MNRKLVGELVILFLILLIVIWGRMRSIDALFAVGVGIWAMIKLFKVFFGYIPNYDLPTRDNFFINLPLINNVPDLLRRSTRKFTFLVLIWWATGILSIILTYKLLSLRY